MQKMLSEVRNSAILIMQKSFRPELEISYVNSELGFTSMEECVEFIIERGGVCVKNNSMWDTKNSSMQE
jgi:hypothetical protein